MQTIPTALKTRLLLWIILFILVVLLLHQMDKNRLKVGWYSWYIIMLIFPYKYSLFFREGRGGYNLIFSIYNTSFVLNFTRNQWKNFQNQNCQLSSIILILPSFSPSKYNNNSTNTRLFLSKIFIPPNKASRHNGTKLAKTIHDYVLCNI